LFDESNKALSVLLHPSIAVKYLDNIPEEAIAELNIPTGVPLVYSLDENMKPIPHANAIAPLQVLCRPANPLGLNFNIV
jgi:hypothetical protein